MLKTEFDEGLDAFYGITGYAIPTKRRDAWWLEFQDYTGEQFIKACRALAKTEKKIPSTATILEQLHQHKRSDHIHCTHCNGTGVIPYFRVRTMSSGDKKYQSGSFAAVRCSCEAGNALSGAMKRFNEIPEFRDEPTRTHYEHSQMANDAEERWLRTVHWPRLYKQLPEGRQKFAIGKKLGITKGKEKVLETKSTEHQPPMQVAEEDDLPF